jgi:diaminopimelate epimerase
VAYVLEEPDAPRQVTVVLDGGDLEVNVGRELEIALTGWARAVFTGQLSDDFVKELNATE